MFFMYNSCSFLKDGNIKISWYIITFAIKVVHISESVRLLCCVEGKKLRYGSMYFLAVLVLVCVDVM